MQALLMISTIKWFDNKCAPSGWIPRHPNRGISWSMVCQPRPYGKRGNKGIQGVKPLDNQCIREEHNVPLLRLLFNSLRTESTTEPKYWHLSNLLSPIMNVVLSKLQDNRISYKITKIIFNREEKGGACVCHLRINSNTRVHQDYMLSIYVRGADAQ